jgi:rod shape-determining protein MreC
VRGIVTSAFLPFQKVFYSLAYGYVNIKDFVSSIGQLKAENEKLIKENQMLLADNVNFSDMENENKLLREQLSLIPREKFDLIAANIISQDPHGMGNWMEIDKGKSDGVAEGMSVIISKSILLGKVQEVSENSSKVLLLTNSKSAVNVMTSKGAAKGIVKGEYGLGIILDMVLQTDSIQTGDDIVTSGIGGEFPRGLFVGSIQEIHNSDDNLFQQAVVSSPVQVSKLQMVFVVKSEK